MKVADLFALPIGNKEAEVMVDFPVTQIYDTVADADNKTLLQLASQTRFYITEILISARNTAVTNGINISVVTTVDTGGHNVAYLPLVPSVANANVIVSKPNILTSPGARIYIGLGGAFADSLVVLKGFMVT